MAMIAGLEEGDPPREEVRRRALALYRRLDALAAEITAHPMAFLGRLEFLITTLLEEWLPQDDAAFSERFVVRGRAAYASPPSRRRRDPSLPLAAAPRDPPPFTDRHAPLPDRAGPAPRAR